jgi:hypothetical protein
VFRASAATLCRCTGSDMQDIFSAVVSATLGFVLLSAGVAKVVHWESLPAVVRAYRLLPEAMVMPFAFSLPGIELLLGGALFTHAMQPWAALAAAALFAVLGLAMTLALRAGRRNIDCGCFQGGLRQTLDGRLVVRNVVFVAGALYCAFAPSQGNAGDALILLPALALFVTQFALASLWALETSRERVLQRFST